MLFNNKMHKGLGGISIESKLEIDNIYYSPLL